MTLVDEAVLRQWVINSRRRAVVAVPHMLRGSHLHLEAVEWANDDQLELPLSQEVLEDAIGMRPVHINRTIQTLREGGLIELGQGTLTVPDVAALGRASDFDDSYLHLRKINDRSRVAPSRTDCDLAATKSSISLGLGSVSKWIETQLWVVST